MILQVLLWASPLGRGWDAMLGNATMGWRTGDPTDVMTILEGYNRTSFALDSSRQLPYATVPRLGGVGGGASGIHLTMCSCYWRTYSSAGWHTAG
jgi:hypothetical protein